ncbi:hypothetical protein BWR15_02030 [Pseudomonas sp. T]|nr:hypothetical protein BWR15_02030 [Pseudomonas sp. T]
MKKLLALILLAGALPLTALASSPLEGTWRIDWALTSPDLLDKYELKDGYYSCQTCAPAFRVKADGKDQPLSGFEGIDAISVSVKNDYQLRLLRKFKGAVVATEVLTVSDDGRHLKGMTYAGPEQEESGSADNVRLGDPVKGQHLISGVWIAPGLRQSERDSTFSYRMVEGRLELKGEDGESYSAPLDGSIVPLKGNPGANRVAVLKLSDRVISTQQFKGNDLVRTMQITVSSDGQLMSLNFQQHESSGNLIVRRVAPAR